jgi:hypothetical protein
MLTTEQSPRGFGRHTGRGLATKLSHPGPTMNDNQKPEANTRDAQPGLAVAHGSANSRGELQPSEPHPAAYEAKAWIAKQPVEELLKWREAFASCAIEGNRLGEVCAATLNRLMNAQPVSDRYLLGLAWTMRSGNWPNIGLQRPAE